MTCAPPAWTCVTLGQYLRPTANHLPVERFVTPAQFDRYRAQALALGFLECVVRPAGALELPRRAGAEPQQRRSRQRAAHERQRRRAARQPPRRGACAPLIRQLGRVDYEPHLARDAAVHRGAHAPQTADEIWFLEHPPVFTLGMNASRAHLLAPGDIPVVQIDRGGQVTYHGPGQLVVYPLIDLKRAAPGGARPRDRARARGHRYWRPTAASRAECRRGAPGVYVDGAQARERRRARAPRRQLPRPGAQRGTGP